MKDLHCHILPRIDDGSESSDMSLEMLRMERDQGVNGIVFTPHFYRDREDVQSFLARRAGAWDRLQERLAELEEDFPPLGLGAEVAWMPNLDHWEELEDLTMGQSRYLLLELPMRPWNSQLIDQLYSLLERNVVTPILAHLERYICKENREYLREIRSMNLPIQLSAAAMTHFLERRRLLPLTEEDFHLISDCHNLTSRPPNLEPGMAALRKALGEKAAEQAVRRSDQLFADMVPAAVPEGDL